MSHKTIESTISFSNFNQALFDSLFKEEPNQDLTINFKNGSAKKFEILKIKKLDAITYNLELREK